MKPAPSNVERRAFGRRETNIKATVRAGNCMHVCFIKDLSEGGALLEFENQVTLPSLLWLRWDDVPSEIICEVRRNHGNRAGVQFARPIVLATRHNASSAEPAAKAPLQPPPSSARVPVRETLVRAADLVAKHRSAVRGGEKPISDIAMAQPDSLLEQINFVRRAQPPVRLTEPPPRPAGREVTNKEAPVAFAPAPLRRNEPAPLRHNEPAPLRHNENVVAALSTPPAHEPEVPVSNEVLHTAGLADARDASQEPPRPSLPEVSLTAVSFAAEKASAEPIDEPAVVPAVSAVAPVPVRVSTGRVQFDLSWPPAAIPSIEASVRSMRLLKEAPPLSAAPKAPIGATAVGPTNNAPNLPEDLSVPDWLLPAPPCPLVARRYGVFVLPPGPLPATAYLQA